MQHFNAIPRQNYRHNEPDKEKPRVIPPPPPRGAISHTARGSFQRCSQTETPKKVVVDRYLMQPIYKYTIRDIITSEEETTKSIELKKGILGNKRSKNASRKKRKIRNVTKRYFKGRLFVNGNINHDPYSIRRINHYQIDDEYEKRAFYRIGSGNCQAKSRPGTTDDAIVALHPPSRRCKTPCGADIDTILHYLRYIKSSTLSAGEDHKSRHTFLTKYAKVEWCYYKDFFGTLFPNITSHKMTEKRQYLPLLANPKLLSYKCFPEMYDSNKSNIDPKHYLYPVMYVKCPSHTMGGTCTKWVNIAFVLYQLILDDNGDLLKWVEEEFAPFLCKYIMPNVDKVTVSSPEGSSFPALYEYTQGWNTGIVTVRHTETRYVRGEPEPVEDIRDNKFILHYVECQHCAEMRQHHYSIGIRYANSKRSFFGTRCNHCKRAICIKCGYNHGGKQSCRTRPFMNEVSEDEIHSVQAALAETNTHSTKCPSCDLLHLKDEACDKVQCSCGTKFCFRCSEDLAHYDNYMDHLIVAMKSDGTNTHWICKKFAKPCPECTRLQLWDPTANGNEIKCGACDTVFTVET